jgi:hypothetical protein
VTASIFGAQVARAGAVQEESGVLRLVLASRSPAATLYRRHPGKRTAPAFLPRPAASRSKTKIASVI